MTIQSAARALAIGALLLAAGCAGADVRATDGRLVHQSSWSDFRPTIEASAAHDLGCRELRLEAAPTLYIAEGCGRRATYSITLGDGAPQAILVGLVPLVVPPPKGR
jgi:hypothetical protein